LFFGNLPTALVCAERFLIRQRWPCAAGHVSSIMERDIRSMTLFVLATVVAWGLNAPARASVHVTYDILQEFSTDGFTASWLHSAESIENGTPENGALLNGARSSRISGSLEGNLSGSVLSGVSGSVSGKLKQLSTYLNSVFGSSYTTYTPFELRLGVSAGGGDGALKFETNGAGTGQFTGGYLDFSLLVDGTATSLLDGTFFFKPQAESGSAVLSPNRGTSSEFTLWGWNWMHDGDPVDGALAPDWADFLGALGYSGPAVLRTPDSGPGLQSPVGIALYVVDPATSAPDGAHSPEPTAFVIWFLIAAGAIVYCRSR
jgi:hypothetical protein